MLKKILRFFFSLSHKQKKLFLKENVFTDPDENITRLIKIVKKSISDFTNYTIVDIGAFDGKTAITFSKEFPGNKILAFEPHPESFRIASEHCSGRPNITLINTAVSDKEGVVEFNITANNVSSSINKPSEESSKDYKNELIVKKTVNVETKPLDAYTSGKPILFLKIDTQGHEIQVLEGAAKTLKTTCFVLVEMSNHTIYEGGCKYYDVDNWMRNHNFQLADIIVTYRKNGLFVSEYDAVYINKEQKIS